MSAAAAQLRGILNMRTGRAPAAVADFCEALAADPDDGDLHAWLALALLASRRLETARIEAELAVGIAAESPMPLYALGKVRTGERRFAEAIAILERLLAVEPEDPANHCALADALRAAGRSADAEKILIEAQATSPASPAVLADLAELALERGDLAAAEGRARDALTLAPEHAGALIVMGNVHLRRGETEAAWEHAVSVLRTSPDHLGATALLVGVKARTSRLLGLWWRYNTWMLELGSRAIAVLLVVFAIVQFVTLLARDFGPAGADSLVLLLWLTFAAYTWFGPAIFKRRLDAELAPVALKKGF